MSKITVENKQMHLLIICCFLLVNSVSSSTPNYDPENTKVPPKNGLFCRNVGRNSYMCTNMASGCTYNVNAKTHVLLRGDSLQELEFPTKHTKLCQNSELSSKYVKAAYCKDIPANSLLCKRTVSLSTKTYKYLCHSIKKSKETNCEVILPTVSAIWCQNGRCDHKVEDAIRNSAKYFLCKSKYDGNQCEILSTSKDPFIKLTSLYYAIAEPPKFSLVSEFSSCYKIPGVKWSENERAPSKDCIDLSSNHLVLCSKRKCLSKAKSLCKSVGKDVPKTTFLCKEIQKPECRRLVLNYGYTFKCLYNVSELADNSKGRQWNCFQLKQSEILYSNRKDALLYETSKRWICNKNTNSLSESKGTACQTVNEKPTYVCHASSLCGEKYESLPLTGVHWYPCNLDKNKMDATNCFAVEGSEYYYFLSGQQVSVGSSSYFCRKRISTICSRQSLMIDGRCKSLNKNEICQDLTGFQKLCDTPYTNGNQIKCHTLDETAVLKSHSKSYADATLSAVTISQQLLTPGETGETNNHHYLCNSDSIGGHCLDKSGVVKDYHVALCRGKSNVKFKKNYNNCGKVISAYSAFQCPSEFINCLSVVDNKLQFLVNNRNGKIIKWLNETSKICRSDELKNTTKCEAIRHDAILCNNQTSSKEKEETKPDRKIELKCVDIKKKKHFCSSTDEYGKCDTLDVAVRLKLRSGFPKNLFKNIIKKCGNGECNNRHYLCEKSLDDSDYDLKEEDGTCRYRHRCSERKCWTVSKNFSHLVTFCKEKINEDVIKVNDEKKCTSVIQRNTAYQCYGDDNHANCLLKVDPHWEVLLNNENGQKIKWHGKTKKICRSDELSDPGTTCKLITVDATLCKRDTVQHNIQSTIHPSVTTPKNKGQLKCRTSHSAILILIVVNYFKQHLVIGVIF